MTYKPFKYKKSSQRTPRMNLDRLPPESGAYEDVPPLTGWVNGVAASDIEERFARALDKKGIPFSFQVTFHTAVSIPGEEKMVDFVVMPDLNYPVEIDGEIAHTSSEQKAKSQIRDALLDSVFKQIGLQPIQHVLWYDLETQDLANGTVERMFV